MPIIYTTLLGYIIYIFNLYNILLGLYSHENKKDILWNEYTFLFNERKWFSRTKFSYKTVVKELRDMNFCISENTLSRFYRRISSPNKNSRKAIEEWVNMEKMIMWVQNYERYFVLKIIGVLN